jgi:hypothetical protein
MTDRLFPIQKPTEKIKKERGGGDALHFFIGYPKRDKERKGTEEREKKFNEKKRRNHPIITRKRA